MLPGIWMSVNSKAISDRDFEDFYGLVRIDSFDGGVAGILHHIDRPHAQEHFVFNDENDWRGCGMDHHARAFEV